MLYEDDESALYTNAYFSARQHGEAKNTRIPIIIVGQDRTGKTSLEKHLLGRPFDSNQISTDGIEVDVVELTDKNAEDPWQVRKEHFFANADEAEFEVLKYSAKLVADKQLGVDSITQSRSQKEVKTDDENISSSESTKTLPDKQLSSEVVEKIATLCYNKTRNKSTTVFVHDFAGQSIFYDTHFCFLKKYCPYLLVVDVNSPLDEPAKSRFKFHDSERNTRDPSLATNLDYLLSWLTVLGRLGEFSSELLSDDNPVFKQPPVVIVLTNSDQCKNEDITAVKKRIQDILLEKAFKNVCPQIHVIDNTLCDRNGNEIRKLRLKLYQLCKSILEQQQPMPVRWLQFEIALSEKMVNQRLMHIGIKECREIGKSCNVADVDSAIAFLHDQGIIVHHKESPVVVLNPPWLMNLFTEIISIPEEQKRKSEDALCYKLLSEGILMQEDLRKKIDGEHLENLMKQFSLICPWEYEGKPAYIIPSVAPLMKKGKDVQEELSHSPVVSVFVDFNCLYVPLGFYTRFQTKMIDGCRNDLETETPKLYCNYTRLTFKRSGSFFHVYLIKIPAKIKVCVLPFDGSSECANRTFVSYLKVVMKECMQRVIEEEHLIYRNVTTSLLVKCSCFERKEACRLQHSEGRCDRDECGYFWSLEELQSLAEDPICLHDPIRKAKRFSRDRVRHWLDTNTGKKLIWNTNHMSPPPELNISLPALKDIKPQHVGWSTFVSELPIDILLVTVNDYEFASCFYYLENTKRSWCEGVGHVDIGKFRNEKVKVALIRCGAGSTEPHASLIVVRNAAEIVKPKAVICVGHCAAVNPEKAKLGDVVISAKLAAFSRKNITEDGKAVFLGSKPDVSKNMGHLIPSAADGWEPPLKEPRDFEVHRDAVMLSGTELVYNSERRQELLNDFPDAIAIEMEGEGLYAAAYDLGIEWAVVKGISHLADGSEIASKEWEKFASAMAASVIYHNFKCPDVTRQWPQCRRTEQKDVEPKNSGRLEIGGGTFNGLQVIRYFCITAVSLCALYVVYHLLRSLSESAFERGLGGKRDDQEL